VTSASNTLSARVVSQTSASMADTGKTLIKAKPRPQVGVNRVVVTGGAGFVAWAYIRPPLNSI